MKSYFNLLQKTRDNNEILFTKGIIDKGKYFENEAYLDKWNDLFYMCLN